MSLKVYRPWTHAEDLEIAKCQENVKQLYYSKNWAAALIQTKILLNKWHQSTRYTPGLLDRVFHGLAKLPVNPSACELVICAEVLRRRGQFGRAYDCYQRAANQGHVYAMCQQGHFLLYGQMGETNLKAGYTLLLRAAHENCKSACYWLGVCYHRAMGTPSKLNLAALWYQRANSTAAVVPLLELFRDHPLEVCPFGVWVPTIECQRLVPNNIHEAMVTTMCIAKRMDMCHGVSLIFAGYVCTRGAWD